MTNLNNFNKYSNEKFDRKKSFDLSSTLELEIEEKSRTLRMSQSELIRRSVQDFISSFGNCINFEIQLLSHDIRREYELIERHEKEIEFHKLKIKLYQKELVEKQKLINSNNPDYVDDELKIKTILLERFATNNYPKNTPYNEIIEQLKVISNNRNADIHVILKINEMLFENKITLRNIIERPLQNIIEEKEIASRDSESF